MKQLLCLSVLFLALTGCIKEDPTETYYLDPEFYQYVLAPKGSWWVYEEENSGARDTVTVISYRQWISDIEEPKLFEKATLILKSTHTGNLHEMSFSTIDNDSPNGEGWYDGRLYCFFTGMTHGQQFGDVFGIRKTYLRKDKIEIIDILYKDIVIIENKSNTDPTEPCNENFVWAKGIGLIQHKTCEGLTWNLIEHHINF